MENEVEKFYSKWCKETGRSGGVLIGKSIKELLEAFLLYYKKQLPPIDNEIK
jgi:hypothetical protein